MRCVKDSHLPRYNPSDFFEIGNVRLRNRVVLAPMSGVTDLPFRALAWRFGAGLVVTEMIASRELTFNTAESWARLNSAGLTPHMVQLAGRDPYLMAEAARMAEANGADIIDINMGCPAKKVVGGYTGSALMREPDHALALIEATVNAVRVPVTVKMRLGWDDDSINAPVLAKRAEDAGVQAVTIHGRTRMQFYKGRADWDAICRVAAGLSVPVIANGDIETREDAEWFLNQTGITAVMVGRGTQGRPWHAGVLAGHEPPSFDVICKRPSLSTTVKCYPFTEKRWVYAMRASIWAGISTDWFQAQAVLNVPQLSRPRNPNLSLTVWARF